MQELIQLSTDCGPRLAELDFKFQIGSESVARLPSHGRALARCPALAGEILQDQYRDLHGKSLFVTPDGDYMDRMDRILGCFPAGLRRGRGPLGKCSSCDAMQSWIRPIPPGSLAGQAAAAARGGPAARARAARPS
jgi:hypothetical protein